MAVARLFFKGVLRYFGVNARLSFLFLELQRCLAIRRLLLKTGGRPKGLAKDKVESDIIAALSVRPH